jgi:hypothetical protein
MSVAEPAPLQPDQIAPAQFRSTEEADGRLRRPLCQVSCRVFMTAE